MLKPDSSFMQLFSLLLLVGCDRPIKPAPAQTLDPESYEWLETLDGERQQTWVKAQNARTTAALTTVPVFPMLKQRFLSILDSKKQLESVAQRNGMLYNFRKDEVHPRGVWRRTTMAEYKKPEPTWETVFDLDALAKAEKESWAWLGPECMPQRTRCLISLSRGGGDASVVREFDLVSKAFVRDGFTVPEAKTFIAWKDLDTVYIGTDFGPGSLTDSGYPRLVKEWKRGTPLSAAKTLFEGQKTDISVSAGRSFGKKRNVDLIERVITTYESEAFTLVGNTLKQLDLPRDMGIEAWDDQVLLWLRSPWTVQGKTWPAGTVLVGGFDEMVKGTAQFTPIFEPNPHRSCQSTTKLATAIVVNSTEDVRGQITAWTRVKGKWTAQPIAIEGNGTATATPLEENQSDDMLIYTADPTTPTTMWLAHLGQAPAKLQSQPAFFDATGLVTEQYFATSKDGTAVPYFQIGRKDLALDGTHPTLMYGYGGFEDSTEPDYTPLTGAAWLERGGVFVLANIRGGGEYGPTWHQAALKKNRQHAYDDFIAIAEDLIKRGVTSPKRLGIQGGSNGGLLVGVMLVERPDLFGAVLCQSPLLDMQRYHKLFAGASWMGEYGNPDVPEEWAWLSKYSPYHNLKSGVTYPRTLFTTSRSDDRVHPGHARKMAARMLEQHQDVLYYENTEGGHTGLAVSEQIAHDEALAFTFLITQLMDRAE